MGSKGRSSQYVPLPQPTTPAQVDQAAIAAASAEVSRRQTGEGRKKRLLTRGQGAGVEDDAPIAGARLLNSRTRIGN